MEALLCDSVGPTGLTHGHSNTPFSHYVVSWPICWRQLSAQFPNLNRWPKERARLPFEAACSKLGLLPRRTLHCQCVMGFSPEPRRALRTIRRCQVACFRRVSLTNDPRTM